MFSPRRLLFAGHPGFAGVRRCFSGWRWRAVLVWIVGAALRAELPSVPAFDGAPLSFERDIRPILKAHCFQCHGEDGAPKGGIDLRLRRLMLTKGEAGQVLVPGRPAESLMFHLMSTGEMPKDGKKLSPNELARVERWIQQGAPTLRPEPAAVPRIHITEEERSFWSFQSIQRPEVPKVRDVQSVRTPIDAFLLARMETNELHFASPADRSTLLRRLTWDLTGLPPTPSEVEAFLKDTSPDAYKKLVDRLLASERYGERWGRHWLDVAGYADSNGGVEADSERAWAWRYRDYVIRSFNTDKPFDQFVIEQLAGDELVKPPYGDLPEGQLDKLIATGFLRMAPDPTGDGPADADLSRNQVIADTLHIVSSSLLGLTVQCAQCHDHRYDPIPQADYYRLRAVFEPAFDWKHWRNPGDRLVSLMAKEDRELAECVESGARAIDAEAQALHDSLIEQFVQKQLELVPEEHKGPVMAARKTPADKRTEDHKRLLREYPTFQDHIILGEVNVDGAKQVEAVRKRATEFRAAKPADPKVHCLAEEPGKNLETFVFHRGDPQQPRDKVEPGGLSVLDGVARWETAGTNTFQGTSGRRLAFARHLTSGAHPLTARVMVNRVWHHHFGTGLVATTGDFGTLGERPSHPELLDWLASEFVSSGWRIKALHRLIVLSAAYQQGSRNADSAARDPDNRLLGRMRVRRMDSESVRDSLLAVSGRLNPTMYGAPVPVALNAQGQFVVGAQTKDGNGDPTGAASLGGMEYRRSVYVQSRRSMPMGMLETFDAPALTPNCEARSVSTVPTQSLMLLNDPFIQECAQNLADRLRLEQPGKLRAQIERLWQLVFVAEPSTQEIQHSLTYLAEQTETLRYRAMTLKKDDKKDAAPTVLDASRQALASLCQTLLASSRFLYVD